MSGTFPALGMPLAPESRVPWSRVPESLVADSIAPGVVLVLWSVFSV
ncbi:hypothetical protein ABH927_004132 [Planotetraspora sp. GP83]